jgi:hypothetical protein
VSGAIDLPKLSISHPKLYIPSTIKIQIDLANFCFWADSLHGSIENFCSLLNLLIKGAFLIFSWEKQSFDL